MIKIENFNMKYAEAFQKLNEDWITTYFKMEKPDFDALSNPKQYILDKGGFIFVATLEGAPVGVCALMKIKRDKYQYELAKMAVDSNHRGQRIGWLLSQAVINKAKELGSEYLFLESNTVLEPAIKLYKKLGFIKITGPKTPYERANIQMQLKL